MTQVLAVTSAGSAADRSRRRARYMARAQYPCRSGALVMSTISARTTSSFTYAPACVSTCTRHARCDQTRRSGDLRVPTDGAHSETRVGMSSRYTTVAGESVVKVDGCQIHYRWTSTAVAGNGCLKTNLSDAALGVNSFLDTC